MSKRIALKEGSLPSGLKVVFFSSTGRVLMNAHRKAGGDASRLGFALLSEMIEVDGKPVAMEDIEEMDLFDVLELQGMWDEVGKEKKAIQASKQ